MLLTTHYMEEAEILCDRLAIMDHGHILEMGTVNELVSKRFKERTVRLDATDQLTDAELSALPAVVSMKRDEVDILLYTADVAATIGSLLVLCEARGVEPRRPRRPSPDPRRRLPRPDRSSAARLRRRPMRALRALTIANVRSFVRDRAALFWTLAFPLIFIFLFGFIFQGSGGAGLDVAWVDEDGSPASAQLRAALRGGRRSRR